MFSQDTRNGVEIFFCILLFFDLNAGRKATAFMSK